jgi:hypothetical protein
MIIYIRMIYEALKVCFSTIAAIAHLKKERENESKKNARMCVTIMCL